jgi:3-methyladenine DNA glycosylase AlkD
MTLAETMSALAKLGTEQTRKTWVRHGATGEMFGVKVGDMKTLMKKLPKAPEARQELALGLYASGNCDAMYLAGLLVDGARMSKKEIQGWAAAARWSMLGEYTVPWIAVENAQARELALAWIDSKQERIAATGWNTYTGIVSTRPDDELDLAEIKGLLARVEKEIGRAPNRVRYCMNGFVIAAATAVKPLLAAGKATARRLGSVKVDMGDTDCKVPSALAMIEKIEGMGRVGRKRATMKC